MTMMQCALARLGFQMHVPKPVEPDNLIAAVVSLAHLEGSRTPTSGKTGEKT